jgi:hypothetical protein
MKRNRGFAIPAQLIVYALTALVLTGAIGVTIYRINRWCNVACTEAREERDELRAERDAAINHASRVAQAWADEFNRAQEKAREEEKRNAERFAALQARAKGLNRALVTVTADLHRVLQDSARAANGPAAPAAGDSPAPDPVPGTAVAYDQRDLAEYAVKAAEAYRDAVSQWNACVDYYDNLAKSQESTHAP